MQIGGNLRDTFQEMKGCISILGEMKRSYMGM